MRRIIGLTLAGVGAFLIVAAILLRTYLPGQLIKFPLNEYLKTQLRGTGVQYFSPSRIHEMSGATMLVTSTVKGDAAAGSSSTAVWNGFTYLYDTTNSLPFEYSSRRFAFDRRTAELVNCCGANVGGNSSIKQTGLVGFLWPFGTQQITYQVFDPAINKPEPARFAGTSTIDGITVNRYVEHVTHVSDGTVTLPGSLVGMSGTVERDAAGVVHRHQHVLGGPGDRRAAEHDRDAEPDPGGLHRGDQAGDPRRDAEVHPAEPAHRGRPGQHGPQ